MSYRARGNHFLVVGPGYYGYGESIKAARRNCIAAGCKASDTLRAYLGDESLGVTGMGEVKSNVCYG